MSYNISFKVKVQDRDLWVPCPYDTGANITYNIKEMITKSTGLEWKNEANNGLVKDVMPKIADGLAQIEKHPEKYKQYESDNGWGTISGCKNFFIELIKDWTFIQEYHEEYVDCIYFWIC